MEYKIRAEVLYVIGLVTSQARYALHATTRRHGIVMERASAIVLVWCDVSHSLDVRATCKIV